MLNVVQLITGHRHNMVMCMPRARLGDPIQYSASFVPMSWLRLPIFYAPSATIMTLLSIHHDKGIPCCGRTIVSFLPLHFSTSQNLAYVFSIGLQKSNGFQACE